MKRLFSNIAVLGLFTLSSLSFAQQPTAQQPTGGWRRLDSSQPPNQPSGPGDSQTPQQQFPPQQVEQQSAPVYAAPQQQQQAPAYGGPPPQQQQQMNYGPPPPPPPQLTIKPGTYLTIRVNQPLSSDHNQAGDAFSATLVRPVVVDGVVVAQRGQTVGGRVAEAKKAGRVEGTSRLGVQLTDLELVDGQQVPLQSQLVSRAGGTSVGRDAGAIAGTTAVGAAIGAAAGWGTGAAIGAGAGAAAGVIGVLLTRGEPTVIYPEQVLTFRVEAPITVSTDRAPQAFRYVDPSDYERPYDNAQLQMRAGPPAQAAPAPYYAAPYPYYSYPYYGYGYGPTFAFGFGPGFYYGRGYYYGGRGYYGGHYYGGGGHYSGGAHYSGGGGAHHR